MSNSSWFRKASPAAHRGIPGWCRLLSRGRGGAGKEPCLRQHSSTRASVRQPRQQFSSEQRAGLPKHRIAHCVAGEVGRASMDGPISCSGVG